MSGKHLVRSPGFAGVRLEIGYGDLWVLVHLFQQELLLSVQYEFFVLTELASGLGSTGRLSNGGIVAGERSKGGKLCRPVLPGHGWTHMSGGPRHREDVLVGVSLLPHAL